MREPRREESPQSPAEIVQGSVPFITADELARGTLIDPEEAT